MFNLAKKDGEPAFINACALSPIPPLKVMHMPSIYDIECHCDVMMLELVHNMNLTRSAWHFVDVKDVEEKNFSSGKYSISYACKSFHDNEKPEDYYFAFRVIQNNMRTGKFIIAKVEDVLSKCTLEDIGTCWLVALNDVKQKCSYRIFG